MPRAFIDCLPVEQDILMMLQHSPGLTIPLMRKQWKFKRVSNEYFQEVVEALLAENKLVLRYSPVDKQYAPAYFVAGDFHADYFCSTPEEAKRKHARTEHKRLSYIIEVARHAKI